MNKISHINHALEIHGPRGQIWRRTFDQLYHSSHQLLEAGRIQEALRAAEDAHIGRFGHIHDVQFRVVSNEETISFFGSYASMITDDAQ